MQLTAMAEHGKQHVDFLRFCADTESFAIVMFDWLHYQDSELQLTIYRYFWAYFDSPKPILANPNFVNKPIQWLTDCQSDHCDYNSLVWVKFDNLLDNLHA